MIASVVPRLDQELNTVLHIVPLYISFAICAPLLGWVVSRVCRLQATAGRAVAFSGASRNSLVVLPLALSVPGAVPLLPTVIVTQTLVELLAELIFIRVISRLGSRS
ncbi:hypothetical protein GCM10007870_24910 [Gluconobacter kondonii]|uniref:Arsenic resistance protein n=1 Tax=Gluconobacter kondonii TaxID=941463 RepID=A0ABQ5WTV2_9PROT|nr:hypothetical protein GCM10007870_24910 [Gluconobacter kondonii]